MYRESEREREVARGREREGERKKEREIERKREREREKKSTRGGKTGGSACTAAPFWPSLHRTQLEK